MWLRCAITTDSIYSVDVPHARRNSFTIVNDELPTARVEPAIRRGPDRIRATENRRMRGRRASRKRWEHGRAMMMGEVIAEALEGRQLVVGWTTAVQTMCAEVESTRA